MFNRNNKYIDKNKSKKGITSQETDCLFNVVTILNQKR